MLVLLAVCASMLRSMVIKFVLNTPTLNYYTNEIDTMVKIADYVDRIHSRQEEIVDNMVELRSIRYFPGTVAERNIRFRKRRLPHGKYKFLILGERMEPMHTMIGLPGKSSILDSILITIGMVTQDGVLGAVKVLAML